MASLCRWPVVVTRLLLSDSRESFVRVSSDSEDCSSLALLSKMIPNADFLSDRLCTLALKIRLSSMQSLERMLI
jgi:hypothetical protein